MKREDSILARAESALLELLDRAAGKPEADDDGPMLVCDAMTRRVASIGPDEPVARAAEALAEQDVGVLPVCHGGGRLSGVITDRDIVVRVIAQGLDPDRLTVGECGTDEPATVSPRDTLDHAAQRMEEQQVRRLPVISGGRVVGIISQTDLAAHGAHQRAGGLLVRMARRRGDRRSARWLLDRPYRRLGYRGRTSPA
jgi:CBS domain-containing protein